MPLVLGIDPGFAKLGLVAVEVTRTTEYLRHACILQTKPEPKNVRIYMCDDNARRITEHVWFLRSRFDEYRPLAVCAESMSHPRNASAAAKVAMVWGVLLTLCTTYQIPLLQRSPQAIKRTMCGRANASKGDVIDAVMDRYSGAGCICDLPQSQREHAADAAAAIVACLDSDVIRMARQI